MLIYREADRPGQPALLLAQLAARLQALTGGGACPHAALVELLIDFGELESAVADAACPAEDELLPVLDDFGQLSVMLGRLFWRSWRQGLDGAALAPLAPALERLGAAALPEAVRLRVPEGYAYYALYPETYLQAAEQLLAELRPQRVVCLGLRNIGSSLSAVVAGTLAVHGCPVWRHTLRPHGPPFERRPVPGPRLAAALRDWADAHFLVVDEGPGLSGSSLCGTAAALTALGVPEARIAFLPSWAPESLPFASADTRARWPRHRKWLGSFEDLWLRSGRLGTALRDLGGGGWRAVLYEGKAEQPAVQPQHERRKYLGAEGGVLLKFAGLGRYGAAKRELAERLAAAGFAPPVQDLRDGFLVSDFVPGRPLAAADLDGELLDTALRYLDFRQRALPAARTVDFAALCGMISVNVAEGLGADWRARLAPLARYRTQVEAAAPVAVDGRMQPHEWLRTPRGYLKTDGVDHHDDHFLPGAQDIAWDVAGFAAEFGLGESVLRDFVQQLAARTGDGALGARLPFYRVAYLAFRLGYAQMAAGALGGTPDGARMAALARRYGVLLRRAIVRL